MPYIILGFGILAALFAFYRFFIKATPDQIKVFFRAAIIIIYSFVLLFFALIGRFIIALGLLLLSLPFVIIYFKNKLKQNKKLLISKADDEDKEE